MNSNAKKLLIFILSVTLSIFAVIGFTACSEGGGDDDTASTVSVSFDIGYMPDDGNRTISKSLNKELKYSLSQLNISTAREGYKFLGFYDNPSAGVQIYNSNGEQLFNLTSNVTLYAQWQVLVFEKTFVSGNSTIADVSTMVSKEVQIGDEIYTLPEPNMSEGYDFIGWAFENENGTLISDGTSVKSEYIRVGKNGNSSIWLNDKPLYAVTNIHSYTLTLYSNNTGEKQERKVVYNTAVEDLPILEDDASTGREFVGWSTSPTRYVDYNNYSDYKNVKSNLELYAFWDMYKVVDFYLDANSTEPIKVKVYKERDGIDNFSWPEISNPGKELLGWYKNKLYNTAKLETLSYSDGIKSVYGKWEIITYKVTFDLNGGTTLDGGKTSLEDIEYTVESEKSLETLVKDRYTFKGWYRGDDETKTPITSIKPGTYGDLNLIAKFQGDDRKVIYHAGVGDVAVEYKLVEYDAEYKLDVPVCDGYGFFGWFLDEELTEQLTDYDGYGISSKKWTSYDEETNVYAKFLEKRYVTVTHSCLEAGTVEIKEHYVAGEKVRIEVVPSSQYTVESIELNGTKVASGNVYEFTMPASNVNINVVYDPNDYVVTLLAGSDVYCSRTEQVVSYGEFYILPVAYKEKHKFIGWEYNNGSTSDIVTNSSGEATMAFLYTTDVTLEPFFISDPNNTDVIIKNVSEFLSIKNKPDGVYQLVTNINLSGRDWEPFDFSGKLNGNGYAITNFTISTDVGNVAMFKTLSGTVSNLTFKSVNIESTNYTGSGASVICYNLNGGTISNCVIESGSVKGEVGYAGGFASIMTSGTIVNCINKASVETDTTSESDSYAIGGIVGFVKEGSITNCENYGSVVGAEFVGGIVGRTQGGSSNLTINYLKNYGLVEGSLDFVGGIIGRIDRDYEYSISDLSNKGAIKGASYVGGIFGYFENCYNQQDNNARKVIVNAITNSGNIEATGSYVGGLIGSLYFDALHTTHYSSSWNGTIAIVMKASQNTGDVTGGLYVGGLFGKGLTDSGISVIESGVSSAKVTATSRVGGLAGYLGNIALNSPSNQGSVVTALETSIEGSSKLAYLGGYVGEASGSNISDAINNSNIDYSKTSCEGAYVGGITGWTSGTLTNCKNEAKIYAPNSNYVGGISGRVSKAYDYNIKNVQNTGEITGVSYVGGVFGDWTDNYNIKDNNARVVNAISFTNSGNIIGKGSYVAGLVGNAYFDAPRTTEYSSAWDGTIALVMRKPTNTGNVTGEYYVGGLFGKVLTDSGTSMIEEGVSKAQINAVAIVGGISGETSTIKLVKTTNEGSKLTVTGTYDSGSSKYAYLGGYVGYATNTAIDGAINTVEIDYSGVLCVGDFVGGITGISSGTFTNLENNAKVYAPNSNYVGGISGHLNKIHSYDITNLKNTGDITAKTYVAGIFGNWTNAYNIKDNNQRKVNAVSLNNSGNILASGDYAGGLVGYLRFDQMRTTEYSSAWDGSVALVLKTSKNTGDVEGRYYVGGLFGYAATDTTTSDLIEAQSTANVKGVAVVGGLIGEANLVKLTATSNKDTQITATGTYDSGSSKYAYLGGYIGKAYNVTIIGVVNEVEIDYSEVLCIGNYVGGITGYSQGIFTNVENKATVYAPNSSYVGGISGKLERSQDYNIESIKNSGNVTGISYVAGIFGDWTNYHKTKSTSTWKVDANDFTNTGTIVGTNSYVGGLVGYLNFEAPRNTEYSSAWDGQQIIYIKNAVNGGNVTGNDYVGGLIGYCYTDSGASQLFTFTQTGVVVGESNASELIGSITNLILPS